MCWEDGLAIFCRLGAFFLIFAALATRLKGSKLGPAGVIFCIQVLVLVEA